ncbi:hypothetical protein AVEN_106312-1 [Araneus ventricosus]|uniref:Uncharacterized protein n=1 Tax=Araneus ventricosus TaxID=182803 RepID=A0A4Y2ASI2_ARAVE|nr:hypothetical protein AVEN_106312-1 [Araneus ventricosus]
MKPISVHGAEEIRHRKAEQVSDSRLSALRCYWENAASPETFTGAGRLFHGHCGSAHTKTITSGSAGSPDIAPSDYCLFQLLKRSLARQHFASDGDVQMAAILWFRSHVLNFFHTLYRKWCDGMTRASIQVVLMLRGSRKDAASVSIKVSSFSIIYNLPDETTEDEVQEALAINADIKERLNIRFKLSGRQPGTAHWILETPSLLAEAVLVTIPLESADHLRWSASIVLCTTNSTEQGFLPITTHPTAAAPAIWER